MRVLLSLGLIVGIAAMHTVLDTPMMAPPPAGGHAVAHVVTPGSATAADSGQRELTSAAQFVADRVDVAGFWMGLPSHETMHACLFLVAVALLLMLARPVMRITALAWRPRSDLTVMRPWVVMRGADRILALQVLRR